MDFNWEENKQHVCIGYIIYRCVHTVRVQTQYAKYWEYEPVSEQSRAGQSERDIREM